MPHRELDHIWYRSRPATESTHADPFVRTRGRLTIRADGVGFEGKDFRTDIRGITSIRYGVHGSMSSPSVEVTYRDGDATRRAYFTDGGLFGYAGLFGGTRRVAGALSHLGAVTYDEEAPRRAQRAMAFFLLLLVLGFLSRLV